PSRAPRSSAIRPCFASACPTCPPLTCRLPAPPRGSLRPAPDHPPPRASTKPPPGLESPYRTAARGSVQRGFIRNADALRIKAYSLGRGGRGVAIGERVGNASDRCA